MKIVLTATDSRGKNLAFATDSLSAHSLKEAVRLAEQEKIEGVHVVNRKKGKYVRSNPNTVSWDNLDHLSLTIYSIMKAVDDLRHVSGNPGFRRYWKYYTANLRDLAKKKEDLIYIDGQGEDISGSPEKIGYLYSRGTVDEIRINSRARQIGGEFYKLSKKILNGK